MQVILFFFVFATISATFAEVIRIPVEQHRVHKDVLMAQQENRLKNGSRKWSRQMPVLATQFAADYLTVGVKFGTPPQSFTAMLSSGASRSWLLEKTHADYPRNGYDSKKSSTSKDLGKSFQDEIASFTATGNWFSDTMLFDQKSVGGQSFGLITDIKLNNSISWPEIEGAFGFNHFDKSVYEQGESASPIDNLLNSQSNKTVTLWLGKWSNTQKTSKGQLTIGGFDTQNCKTEYANKFPVANLKNDGNLVFGVAQFSYDNNGFPLPGVGYIDTSISTIVLPNDAFFYMIRTIQPSYDIDFGVYTYPCKDAFQLGMISIIVQHANNDLSFLPDDFLVDIGIGGGKCALAIEKNTNYPLLGQDAYVFGAPLARSKCLAWDFSNDTVGVYLRKDDDN